MSHVYRSVDTMLGRQVAVKILTAQGVSDPESKQRFLQEARVASNISHQNIISVYDFGEEAGKPYMVMEFLVGESLRDAMKNNTQVISIASWATRCNSAAPSNTSIRRRLFIATSSLRTCISTRRAR